MVLHIKDQSSSSLCHYYNTKSLKKLKLERAYQVESISQIKELIDHRKDYNKASKTNN